MRPLRSLIQFQRCIVMMNEVPDGANVISQLFRKRERFSDEPGNALTQRAIESLDMIRLAAVFTRGLVPLGRKDRCIRGQEISITDRRLAIKKRQ